MISRRSFIASIAASGLVGCVPNPPPQAQISSKNDPQIGSWNAATHLPEPVQEIYPCRHDGRIHLAGGFVAENGRITGPTDAHHVWVPGPWTIRRDGDDVRSVQSGEWKQAASLPRARHHPHLISFDNTLLAIGGFEAPSSDAIWAMQSKGWSIGQMPYPDNITNGFIEIWTSMPELPAPCGEAVLGITGDHMLHLAGGRTPKGVANANWQDHIDTDHHFVLMDLTSKWESAAPCLTKRNSAAGGVIDGNLHIVGGRTVGGGNVAAHEVYDYKEDRWRMAAPMPQDQGGLAAATLGGKLYVFGGEYFSNGGGVYPESWVYDPAHDTWEPLADMPTPRHGLGAVALNGLIYVIGGAKQASGVDTSAVVEAFRP